MQRSSNSIASLAAALARAQIELTNPEKSLVATIQPDRSGGAERSFRYAPLASGLDIVRKILGQHEIATVQTTAIDQGAGVVNLTTTLAHASGEWIASDWPVCAVSETSSPRRMGAALTYARRYALFTLVGIAGEDDLDAPDLGAPTTPVSGVRNPVRACAADPRSRLNGGRAPHSPPDSQPERRLNANSAKAPAARAPSVRPMLTPEASAELRDRLLAQMTEIASGDDAALWAYCNLRTKAGLAATDAQRVEEAFQARLAAIPADAGEGASNELAPSEQPSTPQGPSSARQITRSRPRKIDKSVLSLPESRRLRDREHLNFVAKQPCLICGRRPTDAHHLRFAQQRALGRKVSDEFTVPLCRVHHRELHRLGDEPAWWSQAGIDPTIAARALWLKTHPLLAVSDAMGGDKGNSVVAPLSKDGPADSQEEPGLRNEANL
jgi:hypothetical protein